MVWTAGDTTAAAEATGVLWRVATDCDKAKMEVAKAGAVAPAVALLQAARKDALYVASATEVIRQLCAGHPYCFMLCGFAYKVSTYFSEIEKKTQSCLVSRGHMCKFLTGQLVLVEIQAQA